MPDTFIKIASVTVGSGGASSIDFTSIPSTYTDLCIKVSARDTNSAQNTTLALGINGSGSASFRVLYGTGSTAASFSGSGYLWSGYIDAATSTASTFGNAEIYIPNYAGSNQKSISSDSVTETNATGAYMALGATLWTSTSAITSIGLYPVTLFAQYSTATLYGIKNS